LIETQGGVVIGVQSSDDNHGTSVLGEISGDLNAFGITGICSDAFVSGASFLTLPTAMVIRQAADRLRPGDIILLEIHRPGPGASGAGQDGYIAIEWWPDDLAAIQYAVARGVTVVEAAGNGARNLDDAIYDQPAAGFPSTWRNPFNPNGPDSGAILVGAGAPPPGTHGNDHGPDRSRLDFSNHGRRLDAQGWGREVTSTGYGDLQGGSDQDLWYTDQFSGTSSASPIIVGTVGCIQGVLRALGRSPMTPSAVRQLLRTTGSPQQDAPGRPRTERIGNRPDLRQIITQELNLPAGKVDVAASGILASPPRQVIINVNSPGVTINVGGTSSI
jgi:Subtilase family